MGLLTIPWRGRNIFSRIEKNQHLAAVSRHTERVCCGLPRISITVCWIKVNIAGRGNKLFVG